MNKLTSYEIEEQYEQGLFDIGYNQGFKECKKKVLKILEQDWTGCDLSINSCDKYYIDKIKNEL
jgi:GH24 family phage-related lysozyme (muramidase)